MSLFQHVSKWSLRALLVWGAIEAGGWLYEVGTDHAASLSRLAGHRAAMIRVDERAREAEARAHAAEANLAALDGETWMIPQQSEETLPNAAARALREELLSLGAEAPVVDAAAVAEGGRIQLTARWREPAATSPAVLQVLAQRLPQLRIERLTLSRDDLVSAELVGAISVRAQPRQEASR